MTRQEFLARIRERVDERRADTRLVDAVLDLVLEAITPLVEREWSGGRVLDVLRTLRQTSKTGTGATNGNQNGHG